MQRWAILQAAMPRGITIARSIAMVNALAKLHNFCIDEKEDGVPELAPMDSFHVMANEGVFVPMEVSPNSDVPLPSSLLDGSDHFDDLPRGERRRRNRGGDETMLPRSILLQKVIDSHMVRPSTNIYK